MALLFYDKSVCSLCGRIIRQGEPACGFPHFVMNELDPWYVFSDGAFHAACVLNHEYGGDALRLLDEWAAKVGPGKRKCVVCGTEVLDPDDYLLIGFLSDREGDPLRAFNYTHLHRSCLPAWGDRSRFVELANAALASGSWKGPHLAWLLRDFEVRREP